MALDVAVTQQHLAAMREHYGREIQNAARRASSGRSGTCTARRPLRSTSSIPPARPRST